MPPRARVSARWDDERWDGEQGAMRACIRMLWEDWCFLEKFPFAACPVAGVVFDCDDLPVTPAKKKEKKKPGHVAS